MFFAMEDRVIDGKTYSRRIGSMTMSFERAKKIAIKNQGYVVDETNNIIAQAMKPELPLYVGAEPSPATKLQYIGSGEDCFV